MERYKYVKCEHCGCEELEVIISTISHDIDELKELSFDIRPYDGLSCDRFITVKCPKCGRSIVRNEDITLNGAIQFDIEKMDQKLVNIELHKSLVVDIINTPNKNTYIKIKPKYIDETKEELQKRIDELEERLSKCNAAYEDCKIKYEEEIKTWKKISDEKTKTIFSYNDVIKDLYKQLDEANNKKQEWISVEDGLPKIDTKY